MIVPKEDVIVGVPHASVAVAAPGGGTPAGLQPRSPPGGQNVKVGGVTSTVQVKTCVQVDVFPQPSVAVYVRVWDLRHPLTVIVPNDDVIVGVPHASVAVAAPGAGTPAGLQPRSPPGGQNVKVGGVTSTIQVKSCVQVDVLPQPSVAIYVLVCDLRQPFTVIVPNDDVIVGVPHASVAVAAPGAGTPAGLQPRSPPGGQNVNAGGVTSTVQVKTCVQVDVFPQPSVAVYVRVWDLIHPVTVIEPNEDVIVGVPHASVAVAAPGAGTPAGLQPRSPPGGQNVKVGGVTSTVQVKSCVHVEVLPQPSVAVYVRVCDLRQPLTVIAPKDEVIIGVPHASVAVAAPGAGTPAGLQPRSPPGGQNVKVGGVTSTVQVKSCVHVEELPQPSVAIYVLVCDLRQPFTVIVPNDDVIVGVPHASVAVAAPGAGTPAGLQPRSPPAGQNVNVGGVVSDIQVKSCVQVDVLPHPSVAVYVLVWDLIHPLTVIAPKDDVIEGVPQASVAVAAPGAGTPAGLQPRYPPGGQNVIVGGVTSTVHVKSCVHVDVLPQPSVAVYVRVCDLRHPLTMIAPNDDEMIGVPHASVAVAAPGAGTPAGLQPRSPPGGQNVNVGGVTSIVQVKTCVHVDVLPQPSVAVYVRVCERVHPVTVILPSAEVMAGVPHASVAVAVPAAGTSAGLHPKSPPAGQNVNVGGVVSDIQVKSCVQVDVLPHPSVAVYVLVWDLIHPLTVIAPKDDVIEGVPQASVAVAVPGAGTPAGLQPKSPPGGQNVNVGGVTSTIQVKTCVQVDVFPQPSVAVYVRVCDLRHPLTVIAPNEEVIVGVPHASVAVAAPEAGTPAGLQPRSPPGGQNVNVGGVTSTVQVKTCVHVDVLPHPSVAVYVRVCERVHPVTVILPSAEVMVGVPHASVAVAVPGAGTSAGLHPKSPPAGQNVNVGGVVSDIQVKSCVQVDVLPHPSVAVYVLVWDLIHPLTVIAPKDDVIEGVPQASVAVAVPGAGTPAGLQPRSPPSGQNVIVGGVTSTVHVKSCVHVDVLPQPSVAVYVRVCDLRHPLTVIVPSDDVIVGVPQASVAVAAPGAGTPAGLQPKSPPGGQNVNVGGVTSTIQVKTCVHVDVLPQPSVAVYVRVCERVHPVTVILPSADVMVGVPHASVAVAVPAAGTPAGLHPKSPPAGQKVNVGGVVSDIQVKSCVHVDVLPQPSVAVYVRVCDL